MPVVVSVMGFSRDELVTLVEAVGARDEVVADRAERLLPERRDGPDHGRRPRPRRPPRSSGCGRDCQKPLIVKLTPNATDPAAVARAAEGGRSGRRFPGEHAQGHGASPAHARTVAGRAHRRGLGPRDPRDRARAGGRGVRGGRYSGRSGWVASPPGRDAADFMAAGAAVDRRRHRELPRSGRRPPDWGRARARLGDWQRPYRGGFGAMRHAIGPIDPANCGKRPANEPETVMAMSTSLNLRSRSS